MRSRPGWRGSVSRAATASRVIRANRPKLYWSIMAAQMLGAVPVPVYADAVADELAFVLAHAQVRYAAVQDQEQVDKLLAIADRLPTLAHVLYDEPRGLRSYDHERLHAIVAVIADGRAALAQDATLAAWLDGVIAAGAGNGHSHDPQHLGHHRDLQGRDAVGGRLHRGRN